MNTAALAWLGMAISVVEFEHIRTGRNRDRIRRMFANNQERYEKSLRKMLNEHARAKAAQRYAEERRAAEVKREAVAKAHEETTAKLQEEAAE